MASAAHPFTPKKRALFLTELAKCGNVSRAAELIGISRRTAYNHREANADFAAAWDEAMERAADRLEEEATRRAVEGVEKYITSAKGLVYGPDGQPLMERTYSDTLLIFLLKGARPERYRDNVKHEHDGKIELAVTYVNDWRSAREDADGGANEQSE